MRVKDCGKKLRVGMRVRVEVCSGDNPEHYHREGLIQKIYIDSVDVDDLCTATEITILSKPMDITKAKYAIQYERDEDPTEYFKNLKDAESRINELLEESDVKKEKIYLYRVADLKRVERPVSYKLVDVK